MPHTESVYDRLRPNLSAEDVLDRLGVEIVRRTGAELCCRPLCHESASGESLHVNAHTGRWLCRACSSSGVYGDLIQLVEYVRSGGSAPTHGARAMDRDTHRDAVQWLCDQYLVEFDSNSRAIGDPALDIVHMVAMEAHRHLLREATEMREWIAERWGFGVDVIEQYGIGYLPSMLLPSILSEAKRKEMRGAFASSGLGWYDAKTGEFDTRFRGRVTFPYLEHGRAVYLIGRATKWTPKLDDGREPPKYHKLRVHSKTHPHVSPAITNDHLFNERVMDSADSVVIAEGIADAIALSTLGVPVVSPVTINLNEADRRRFVAKARSAGLNRVEILFDNELSGAGGEGARRLAKWVVEAGIPARILSIPLGEAQERARDEVVKVLGAEGFAEYEETPSTARRGWLTERIGDEKTRAWVSEQIAQAKVDVAEWYREVGPGAAGRIDQIRKRGVDYIGGVIAFIAAELDQDLEASDRLALFGDALHLAAHIESRMDRDRYAGEIAKAAGKGVPKAEVARRIAEIRREVVKPSRVREKEREEEIQAQEAPIRLTLLPPDPSIVTVPKAPPAPGDAAEPPEDGKPARPKAPGTEVKQVDEHDRYDQTRRDILALVEKKKAHAEIGLFVARTILRSMGYTSFRTPEDLFLVRGSTCVRVGAKRRTAEFATLLLMASGLTDVVPTHRPYIVQVFYFLERGAVHVADVSWSHVGDDGTVTFPTGEASGRVLQIRPGACSTTLMSKVKLPAVAGSSFRPFRYLDTGGGIEQALEAFRWVPLSPADRMLLIYWIVCLPILRRIGSVPIVRVEGGSGSGKTRIVTAVSMLVNGQRSAATPTPAALASRMATDMLTIADTRETADNTPALTATLPQATHLGAREKRRGGTDTDTVVERICGALLMNGIEPIHGGATELASRMLILRGERRHRAADSPSAERPLHDRLLRIRDAFWSDAARVCSEALELDEEHGERLGAEIEEVFGASKIGRLSSYLRVMYLAWVAGFAVSERAPYLERVSQEWLDVFEPASAGTISSLVHEELTVTVLAYVFALGRSQVPEGHAARAEGAFGLDGSYRRVLTAQGSEEYLGPMRASRLARFARMAARELGGPRKIGVDLQAGQLEARLIDSPELIAESGYEMSIDETSSGRRRFTFARIKPAESRSDLP